MLKYYLITTIYKQVQTYVEEKNKINFTWFSRIFNKIVVAFSYNNYELIRIDQQLIKSDREADIKICQDKDICPLRVFFFFFFLKCKNIESYHIFFASFSSFFHERFFILWIFNIITFKFLINNKKNDSIKNN